MYLKSTFSYLCNVIKEMAYRFFTVALALLVLFSTGSFTIEKHFCGGNLVDASVFSDVKKCAMESSAMEQGMITKKSCCKDVVDLIEGQDELNLKAFDELHLDAKNFAAVFVYSYAQLFATSKYKAIPYNDYSPPNLVYDIIILDQVFLI